MDDRSFNEREEEEQDKEFEEEAEEDYEYLDYDYDDFEKVVRLINQPKLTNWVGSDGTNLEGVVVDWPILGRSKNISVFNDVCPICFKALTGSGKHQICCLPCGHIFGRSCINQWLQQSESYRKCPQCKSLCTLKDVTLLYATRPCDARGALPKVFIPLYEPTNPRATNRLAGSPELSRVNLRGHREVSTKRFPFTKLGFKAFKRYALRRLDDESGMRLDSTRRQDYARRQYKEIFRRWNYSDAVQQPDKYYRLANKFLWRDHSLGRRMGALRQRMEAYHASIDFFCAKVQRV